MYSRLVEVGFNDSESRGGKLDSYLMLLYGLECSYDVICICLWHSVLNLLRRIYPPPKISLSLRNSLRSLTSVFLPDFQTYKRSSTISSTSYHPVRNYDFLILVFVVYPVFFFVIIIVIFYFSFIKGKTIV